MSYDCISMAPQVNEYEQDDFEDDYIPCEISELMMPVVVRKWVRSGRIPYIARGFLGNKEKIFFYLPPDHATFGNRMQMEDGGVVCFLDDQDTVGNPCKMVAASIEHGEEIIRLFNEAIREMELEQMPFLQRQWTIFTAAVLRYFGKDE